MQIIKTGDWDNISIKKTSSGVPIINCDICKALKNIDDEETVLITGGLGFGISEYNPGLAFDKTARQGLKSSLMMREQYEISTRNHIHDIFPEIPPKIKMWYSTHANLIHDTISCLPLGVNCDILKYKKGIKAQKYLYLNFTDENGRDYVIDKFEDYPFATIVKNRISANKYFQELQEHKFCICPQGNGVDTYRFWECLYLGVIPIVTRCPLVEQFEDLPIFIVNSWSEFRFLCRLSTEFLDYKYNEIKHKSCNTEKLDYNYWVDKILNTD